MRDGLGLWSTVGIYHGIVTELNILYVDIYIYIYIYIYIIVPNNVLLVKIEGPIWYTIYYHLPVVKGVNKPLY